MYTCIGSWENGNCPYQDVVYTPPPPPPAMEGVRNSKGKGVQEEAISKGVGWEVFFFQGHLKQELLFLLMVLHLTVIHVAECFFHSLHDIVYVIQMSSAHE